jgi:superfamily II DNA or RNA helicase
VRFALGARVSAGTPALRSPLRAPHGSVDTHRRTAVLALRPYQRECLERLRARYREGKRRLLVSLPTGTGKTVVFAHLPSFFAMKRRLLVLAHRQELLEQAAEKFRAADPDLAVGIEQGERRAPRDARVVIASVPTLGRADSGRITDLDPEDFYLVVVDEAHHAVAPTYRRIFDHFGLLAPGSKKLLVGFTATPRRGDQRGLGQVFEEIAYKKTLSAMIADGFLCPLRGFRVSSGLSLDGVRVRHGDFIEAELARAVATPERNALVVKAYGELAAGRRALAFCVDVAHARALAEAFRAGGVRAGAVWGAMGAEPRRAALRAFAEGELSVLTNCNLLTEGFDEPRVDCVLMARPTQSELLYAQMVGRGTRLHADKSDLLVIDIADNSRRHKLAGLNALFGLPDALDLRGLSALTVARQLEQLARRYPWIELTRVTRADELALAVERVDLIRFEPPDEVVPYTSFAWCRSPGGGFRLNLPDGEWVTLHEDHLGRWVIACHSRREPPLPAKPLARATLPEAIEAVDEIVATARREAVMIIDLDAEWRERPASEKQLRALEQRRIPRPAGLTRGQASWIISMSAPTGDVPAAHLQPIDARRAPEDTTRE